MLRILYVYGAQDTTLPLDQTSFTGDPMVDRLLTYIQNLDAGCCVQQDTSGYIALADGSRATYYRGIEGVIINDAAGNEFENWPALASGLVPVVTLGLIETDKVVETNITYGTILYAGTSTNVGLFTSTAPQSGVLVPAGVARSANSASDKTTRIRLLN